MVARMIYTYLKDSRPSFPRMVPKTFSDNFPNCPILVSDLTSTCMSVFCISQINGTDDLCPDTKINQTALERQPECHSSLESNWYSWLQILHFQNYIE